LADSLSEATLEASSTNSTKPVTAWRNHWFKKDVSGKYILKSHDRQIKLRAICSIYEQYLLSMSEAELYDFDDMILRVVHALETFDELRIKLQEKHKYIMVDEFQDTNMAQMRILHNLTNNEAHGDTPNILVVGDDDQAIYSFQGADISNILDFKTNYPKTEVITLTDNYRSKKEILDETKQIIAQGSDRLENRLGIDKSLNSQSSEPGKVRLLEAASEVDERAELIRNIVKEKGAGTKLADIAVLTRKHSEIESLLPYFSQAGIPVHYERRDNVLDMPIIVFLEQLSRTVINISTGNHHQASVYLSQLLAHPAWGVKPETLWRLSLKAHKSRTYLLEEMQDFEDLMPIRDWLITVAFQLQHTSLEQMLDVLIGKTETDDAEYKSPVYEYFFSDSKLQNNPSEYIYYLQALRIIRTKLRGYYPGASPTLISFIEFIDLHRSIGSGITSIRNNLNEDDAVSIMTAHKSKGLEFESVYIVNAIDSVWGERARTKHRMISYPENLPLSPVGDSASERLRLFYVAATRSKNNLTISYSATGASGKNSSVASFLIDSSTHRKTIEPNNSLSQLIINEETPWYERIVNIDGSSFEKILKHEIETYQLSVTHLTNFLDVTRGGPHNFLLQNLLHFPQAMSAASAYGSAIHSALQQAHLYLSVNGQKQAIEDTLRNFEIQLNNKNLSSEDYGKYLQKGRDDLQIFLNATHSTLNQSQKAELNFKYQNSTVGEARITGAIDLVDIDEHKTMVVTDYKTGKPAISWTGKTDYEKIKLHKYKQQLMFYKLLVESSRDFHNYKVEEGLIQFVEPTGSGEVVRPLSLEFDSKELDDFKVLLAAVWDKIVKLELPDTSSYPQTHKGILEFEKHLTGSKATPSN
jgi:DNA helicase-2/ATP-dependent DNA helicase PcrA